MRLDAKDAVGVVMIFGALTAVVIHNAGWVYPDGHPSAVPRNGGSATRTAGEPATAFVDFHVVPTDRDVVLRHQVLIVRGTSIQHIGNVGEVQLPPDARVVEGHGTQFLAPGLTDALLGEIGALRDAGMSGHEALATATSNAGRYAAAGARFRALEPGARADILLLDRDPRIDAGAVPRSLGVVVRGEWYPRSNLDEMLSRVAESR